jgi:hypothetical protein
LNHFAPASPVAQLRRLDQPSPVVQAQRALAGLMRPVRFGWIHSLSRLRHLPEAPFSIMPSPEPAVLLVKAAERLELVAQFKGQR